MNDKEFEQFISDFYDPDKVIVLDKDPVNKYYEEEIANIPKSKLED